MNQTSATKRLLREAQDLKSEPSDKFDAYPLEDNLFEWHFTIRGPEETPFEGGMYHGRILFPFEYPFKPPHILFLTPNGRFAVNEKICLSITGYHPEHWMAGWGVRTVLLGMISMLPTKADGSIGAIETTQQVKKELALKSCGFKCLTCGEISLEQKCNEADDEENLQETSKVVQEEVQETLNEETPLFPLPPVPMPPQVNAESERVLTSHVRQSVDILIFVLSCFLFSAYFK